MWRSIAQCYPVSSPSGNTSWCYESVASSFMRHVHIYLVTEGCIRSSIFAGPPGALTLKPWKEIALTFWIKAGKGNETSSERDRLDLLNKGRRRERDSLRLETSLPPPVTRFKGYLFPLVSIKYGPSSNQAKQIWAQLKPGQSFHAVSVQPGVRKRWLAFYYAIGRAFLDPGM